MRAVLGGGFRVDGLVWYGGAVCLERAVVMRRDVKWEEVWVVWDVEVVGGEGGMRRSFRNESQSGVRFVMEMEFLRVVGSSLKLIHFDNMSFCD
ncbi:hypothetical protein QJS04_geneDACA008900 [Acorus gramineus]|uniref:Uncharacterized protein n=1 Tax=Acorus gramineus TaxID=55184 RepID=A0AAV9ACH7_ACOGR|nr:hypothetical protein QJS04_geneDACA008900 [Acorus gramineus]